jgi:hypothetical protein
MVLHHILGQITARALWLLAGNPGLTGEQAREIAAKELAREHRAQAKQRRKHGKLVASASNHTQGELTIDKAGEILIARVTSVVERLFERNEAELSSVTKVNSPGASGRPRFMKQHEQEIGQAGDALAGRSSSEPTPYLAAR